MEKTFNKKLHLITTLLSILAHLELKEQKVLVMIETTQKLLFWICWQTANQELPMYDRSVKLKLTFLIQIKAAGWNEPIIFSLKHLSGRDKSSPIAALRQAKIYPAGKLRPPQSMIGSRIVAAAIHEPLSTNICCRRNPRAAAIHEGERSRSCFAARGLQLPQLNAYFI